MTELEALRWVEAIGKRKDVGDVALYACSGKWVVEVRGFEGRLRRITSREGARLVDAIVDLREQLEPDWKP